MKELMKIGDYASFDKKVFRCVEDHHSQMKRCLLCDLREFGLCSFVRCQPDERDDNKAVIFRLTRNSRIQHLKESCRPRKGENLVSRKSGSR